MRYERSVSGRDRCDDGMRGGVNDRNSVGICVGHEDLCSISRNYQFPRELSGRDGRDHTQCGGIDDRDRATDDIGRVNLLAVGRNGNCPRLLSNRNVRDQCFRRCVDDGYVVAPVVGAVDAVTRGRDAQATGGGTGGNIRLLVGGGINHVHFSHGLVRDICGASIRREQDVFEPMSPEEGQW